MSTADSETTRVDLTLGIDDPDVVAYFRQFPQDEWHHRAETALRIGVLAMRQASGFIDVTAIRDEGRQLTADIDARVTESMSKLVGPESQIMRAMDPKQTDGLVQQLRKAVEEELGEGNDTVLAAFDLNRPDSALSRLVTQMRATQDAIRGDFTLDRPDSPMSRMLQQLKGTLAEQELRNGEFREHVKLTLQEMAVRKQEEQRGTLHGLTFEDAVTEYILRSASASGDVGAHTGTTTGLIRNCKVGDCVLELGADSMHAGESIVFEAKESASYGIKDALAEIDEARRNRGAAVGVFVFSKRSAPAGIDTLSRHGHDVIVVWDPEDPATDVWLDAAIALARGLVFESKRGAREMPDVDFSSIDKAIESVAKRADTLEKARTMAVTVENSGKNIAEAIRIAQDDLRSQVDALRETIEVVRTAIAASQD